MFEIRRQAHPDGEPVVTSLNHRLDVRLLPRLRREHEGRSQWHLHVRERGVRTPHRPSPQPGDHRQLPPLVRLQVRPLPRHLRRDPHLGIQMPDAPLRLVPHPPPVVPNVLGEPRRPPPALRREVLPIRGTNRRFSREPRRDLDHCLGDEHRHRVEIARVRLQSQSLRLQRDRPAPGEGIVERRKPLPVEQLGDARVVGVLRAGPAPALPDLSPRPVEHLVVGGALPEDEFPQYPEKPLPLLFGGDVAERVPVVRAAPASLEFPLGGAPLR